MLTRDEVQHIAKLARLGLTEEEIKNYQKELSSILDYFEKLKKADVSGHKKTDYFLEIEKVSRKDGPDKKKNKKERELLLKLFSQTKNGYLKIKSVLWN